MNETFPSPDEEDSEKLKQIEEFRDEIRRLQEEAVDSDMADADYYLNQINPGALGPHEAYYFKLFREGELDDDDLKEYMESIKERVEDKTIEDFVFDEEGNELMERKISWHFFMTG